MKNLPSTVDKVSQPGSLYSHWCCIEFATSVDDIFGSDRAFCFDLVIYDMQNRITMKRIWADFDTKWGSVFIKTQKMVRPRRLWARICVKWGGKEQLQKHYENSNRMAPNDINERIRHINQDDLDKKLSRSKWTDIQLMLKNGFVPQHWGISTTLQDRPSLIAFKTKKIVFVCYHLSFCVRFFSFFPIRIQSWLFNGSMLSAAGFASWQAGS